MTEGRFEKGRRNDRFQETREGGKVISLAD